jgi:hypothetical protein
MCQDDSRLCSASALPGWGVTAGFAIAMIDALGPDGVAPFIYFQF